MTKSLKSSLSQRDRRTSKKIKPIPKTPDYSKPLPKKSKTPAGQNCDLNKSSISSTTLSDTFETRLSVPNTCLQVLNNSTNTSSSQSQSTSQSLNESFSNANLKNSNAKNLKNSSSIMGQNFENLNENSPTNVKKRADIYDTLQLKSLILPDLAMKFSENYDQNLEEITLENFGYIGSGSFSQVFKMDICKKDFKTGPSSNSGTVTATEKLFTIAVKIITTQSSPERMLREVEIMDRAMEEAEVSGKDNFVIPIITMFKGNQILGITQPYIPHIPFEIYYQTLSEIEILSYMKCLLTAVKTVHNIGYVHRDIKPANFIFIQEYKTGYLIDFGLSELISGPRSKIKKSKSISNLSSSFKNNLICDCDKYYNKLCQICWSKPKNNQERSGTPGYRSPEILQKSSNQGPPIDVWAVGCILIQILSKRAPFFPAKDEKEKEKEKEKNNGINDENDSNNHNGNARLGSDEPKDLTKYLDNDAICFSHQLTLIGYKAMIAALKQLNLKMVLSDEQKNLENINHEWSPEYLKQVCLTLRRNGCKVEDGRGSDFKSDFLFELNYKLLDPSYSDRITPGKAIELIDENIGRFYSE